MSDNRGGARQLTEVVIEKLERRRADLSEIYFFGGVADDDATRNRLLGFHEALEAHGVPRGSCAIDCCGYPPTNAALALAARYRRLGRLPVGLFINGVTALEGALRFTATLGLDELRGVVAGCFDWDPFAAHLPFDVTMMRQNVEALIAEGFALIDGFENLATYPLVLVPPSFAGVGELDGIEEDWHSSGFAVDQPPEALAPGSEDRPSRG